MVTIDYYFSLLSPFSYLAGDRLEEIAARHGVQISYHATDFMAVMAESGGVPVPKRHPSRQAYRLQDLVRLADGAGLPINLHPAHWPTDATRASGAVIAVAAKGGDAGAVARGFMSACWAEERDIADAGVIAAVLKEAGEDAQALASGIDDALPVYAASAEKALAAGVFGAPFYIVGDERFWGQDRLSYLDRYLDTVAK